jgi:hypothetical protein
MTRKVTIDIIDEKVMKLLRDLELLKLIHLHDSELTPDTDFNVIKYKGLMTVQTPEEIDLQLKELRDSWS